MKKLFILFIAVAGFGVSSYAQTSQSTTASASIVAAIQLVKVRNLSFGSILPASGAASAVVLGVVDASKSTSSTGATPTGASNNAKFTVTAGTGSTYGITYPANVTLTGTGTPDMIATLSCDLPASGNAAATTTFYIGGSLAVAAIATQTAGTASGTFSVAVAYE